MGIFDRFRRKTEAERRREEEYQQVLGRQARERYQQALRTQEERRGQDEEYQQDLRTHARERSQQALRTQEEGYRGFNNFDHNKHFANHLKNFYSWIFLIAGIIVAAIVNMWFIAPFIMLFFYSMFPSEWKLRMDAERQFAENFPDIPIDDEHVKAYMDKNQWMFILKAILKLFVILSFPLAFYFGMGNMLLVLASVFIGYFILPSETRDDKPEAKFQAGLKPILAIAVAILFYLTLESGILAILSFAFFFYLPIEKTEGLMGGKAGKYLSYVKTGGAADKLPFAIAMLIAAVVMYVNPTTFSWGWGLELFTPMGITMGSIWLMSFLTGLSTPPQSRAYVGLIMIAITLVAYSSTFPTTVGTAVFGMWWPTIEHTISGITAPLGSAFGQMGSGMNDAWLMMSCPTCYYEQKQREQQITTSKAEGTVKSIEITKFESLMPEVDPTQTYSLAGTIELENQGEFDANNVVLELSGIYAAKSSGRGGTELVSGVVPTLNSCTGTTVTTTTVDSKIFNNSCKWTKEMFPGDMKLATFKYEISGSDLGKCNCRSSNGRIVSDYKAIDCNYGCLGSYNDCIDSGKSVDECKEENDCNPSTVCTKEYIYAGNYITLKAKYSYNYAVNVSLPIEVMDKKLFEQQLKDKKIKPKEITSSYSGGPVKATLYTQKQPLQSEEPSFGRISIYNQGNGIVSSGTEVVLIAPEGVTNVEPIAEVKLKCTDDSGKLNKETVTLSGGDYNAFKCATTQELLYNEYATFAFTFDYTIPSGVDTKSLIFTGYSSYTYKGEKETELPIVWTALMQD